MEDNKETKKEETKEEGTKEEEQETKQEETKKEEKQENKDTKKEEKKEDMHEEKHEEKHETKESDDKYSTLELQVNAITNELNAQKIENAILKKIDNKDLQKAVLETGLVKNVDDIDKVIKIVELSQSVNKNKFKDGYKPADEFQGDEYKQAEAKKDVLSMIKHKLTNKNN